MSAYGYIYSEIEVKIYLIFHSGSFPLAIFNRYRFNGKNLVLLLVQWLFLAVVLFDCCLDINFGPLTLHYYKDHFLFDRDIFSSRSNLFMSNALMIIIIILIIDNNNNNKIIDFKKTTMVLKQDLFRQDTCHHQ